MAGRAAVRFISRRFSTNGKVLSEEEKAAENVYIKKMEKEKLEKLARQGPKPAETSASGSGGPATPADAAAAAASDPAQSTAKVSTDKSRNYAVVAGVLTLLGAAGWYMKSGSKKTEEVHD